MPEPVALRVLRWPFAGRRDQSLETA